MAPLIFADTYNMVAYLSKSDASVGFDQIVDFLNVHAIQYALVINPTIYVSCIKQFWVLATIKKVNDVFQLRTLIDKKKVVVTEDVIRQDLRLDDADGVECFPNKEIFAKLALPRELRGTSFVVLWPLSSSALLQNVFTNMRRVGKGFSGVETPLFTLMLVQPQPHDAEEEEDEIPTAPIPPSPTNAPSPGQEVREEEDIKAFRVKEAKKEINADDDISMVDMETQVDIDAELQGRTNDDNAATKDANAAEATVFDDEKVNMTMAQTLIKMKAEKAKLLDEQITKRLYDEEVEQAAGREKQEKDDLERAQVLQQQYDDKEENIDWNDVAE
nr:hypothetical protein [Tanacetum cinerariifolium]